MDSVQRLRALAQKTGALQSTPQQTVTTVTKPAPAKSATSESTTSTTPAPTVIKIESADPQVVYVPTYNPNTVYGTAKHSLPANLSSSFSGRAVYGQSG